MTDDPFENWARREYLAQQAANAAIDALDDESDDYEMPGGLTEGLDYEMSDQAAGTADA